jgi:hypothetical protein
VMPSGVELGLELGVEDFLEDVLEAAVIGLEDGVLGREIDRVLADQAVVQRGAGEVADRVVEVVHAMATPAPGNWKTSFSMTVPSSPTNFIVSVPLPGNLKSVARYWSPKAWRPTTIGLVQPGTRRGTFLQMIGSRKITPPRMLRIVPLGDFHIFLRLNSFTRLRRRDGRALDADAVLLDGVGRVDRDLVVGGVAVLDAEVVILQVDVEIGVDQLVLDELPDDPGHLVAVDLDDGVGTLIFAILYTCYTDDPSYKDKVSEVHFDVVTEDGKPLIADFHRIADDGKPDSLMKEMQDIAKNGQ